MPRATARAECPHFVPPTPIGGVRVTLTAPLEDVQTGWIFLGDYAGDLVRVWVGGADAIRVRRTIEAHGSAIYDATNAYVHDARPEDLQTVDPEHIPLSEEERNARRLLAWLVRRGLIGPSEGAAS